MHQARLKGRFRLTAWLTGVRCRQDSGTRDNRAHDEELIPTALNKRFAPNEWQLLTGLR